MNKRIELLSKDDILTQIYICPRYTDQRDDIHDSDYHSEFCSIGEIPFVFNKNKEIINIWSLEFRDHFRVDYSEKFFVNYYEEHQFFIGCQMP